MWALRVFVISVVVLAIGALPQVLVFADLPTLNSSKAGLPLNDELGTTAFRLPKDTIPINYIINLKTEIHEGKFGFTGVVIINFQALADGVDITLHIRQLTIKNVEMVNKNGDKIGSELLYTLNPETELLVITPTDQLELGNSYRVKIEYEGTLRDDYGGFFRTSYKDAEEKTVWLAATQFETTDARHAFPCYDEPGIRATYTISIEHHKSYTALSNMPEEGLPIPTADTENVITKFQTTPKMQTYLVAFVISNLKSITKEPSGRVSQRVFATPAQIDAGHADYGLDFGDQVLQKLEEILGVQYPLAKIDQVALPGMPNLNKLFPDTPDMPFAMENYGLVTYQDTGLLYNPTVMSFDKQFTVVKTIAHEFAHQFFGNRIAPAWWSYIWLNEGFATLFESYASSLIHTNWRIMELFVVEGMHDIFQLDSLDPKPMTFDVDSAKAIDSVFTDISYTKAGSVLRMLQSVMTDLTFAKALKLYLDKVDQEPAKPEDLYLSLKTAYDADNMGNILDLTAFMKSWELQAGYPVVNVARGDDNIITLNQERFHQNSKTDTTDLIWTIPLSFSTASNPDFTKTTPDAWLRVKTMTLSSVAPKTWTVTDWVLFNLQETGYYRVNYDLKLWQLLSDLLTEGDFTKIHPVNRAQLIDDSFNLARTERLAYSVPFDIISYLKNDDDLIAWTAADRALTFLQPRLVGSPYYNHFRKFMRENAEKFYTKLTSTSIDREPLIDKHGRNMAITWACSMGHTTCLSDTTAQMVKVSTSAGTVDPDLQKTVYCNGLRQATQATYDAMKAQAINPANIASKSLILSSLGCSSDINQLKGFLESSLDTTVSYTEEDRFLVVDAVYTNGELAGLNMAMDFMLTENLATLEGLFGKENLVAIVSNLAERVVTVKQEEKINEIFKKMIEKSLLTTEAHNLLKTRMTTNLSWLTANVPSIEAWLNENIVENLITEAPITIPTTLPTTLPTTMPITIPTTLSTTVSSLSTTISALSTTVSLQSTTASAQSTTVSAQSTTAVAESTTVSPQSTTESGCITFFVSTTVLLFSFVVSVLIS